MKKKDTMVIPPEGYRKYPWALRGVSPPEEFLFEDPEEGERAARAARTWMSRNQHLDLRAVTRKSPGGMRVFFVKRRA